MFRIKGATRVFFRASQLPIAQCMCGFMAIGSSSRRDFDFRKARTMRNATVLAFWLIACKPSSADELAKSGRQMGKNNNIALMTFFLNCDDRFTTDL